MKITQSVVSGEEDLSKSLNSLIYLPDEMLLIMSFNMQQISLLIAAYIFRSPWEQCPRTLTRL